MGPMTPGVMGGVNLDDGAGLLPVVVVGQAAGTSGTGAGGGQLVAAEGETVAGLL